MIWPSPAKEEDYGHKRRRKPNQVCPLSRTWTFEGGKPAELRKAAKKIMAAEFRPEMQGSIFCPVCCTPLSRTPTDKQMFSNGRRACFAHLPSYSQVHCDLRSKKPEGLRYTSEEEAKQAIAEAELVVVSAFLKEPPEAPLSTGEYDQSAVEDAFGPLTDVAIARHTGDFFRLPSRLSTVSAICRNFDENLLRYYCMPGHTLPERLLDMLTPVTEVVDTTDSPRLYWGEIERSFNAGRTPKPTNLRMTELRCNNAIKDFFLKDSVAAQLPKASRMTPWGASSSSGVA